MVNLEFAVASVVILFAVLHVVMATRSRRRFRSEAGPDDGILAYGWGVKGLVLGATAFWVAAFLVGTRGLQEPSVWAPSSLAVAVIVLAILFPIWALGVEAFGTEYHVTPEGIRKHSPWTRNFVARWDEVGLVSYSMASQWTTIRTSKGKIRIHDYISGKEALTEAMLEKEMRMYEDIAKGNVWGLRPGEVTGDLEHRPFFEWIVRCISYEPLVDETIRPAYKQWAELLRAGRSEEYEVLFRPVKEFAEKRSGELGSRLHAMT